MSRVEETNKVLKEIDEVPGVLYKNEATRTLCYLSLLGDIAKSLAVIADALVDTETDEQEGESEGGEF